MEIKIGLENTGKELAIDTELSFDELQSKLAAALEKNEPLKLASANGDNYLIVPGKICYISAGKEKPRQVGFGFADN